jgi:hypothetical protein
MISINIAKINIVTDNDQKLYLRHSKYDILIEMVNFFKHKCIRSSFILIIKIIKYRYKKQRYILIRITIVFILLLK